ncbi:hypothetical protein [Mucilaginibacter antarcticus]|uniref:hypothetical protein n=1 Tax=Mucilaginibacter antarcticus TaxID=1855725 RepID=UPI0036422134
MLHLVSSSTTVTGGQQKIVLPVPKPKNPYFGEGAFTPELKKNGTTITRMLPYWPTPPQAVMKRLLM